MGEARVNVSKMPIVEPTMSHRGSLAAPPSLEGGCELCVKAGEGKHESGRLTDNGPMSRIDKAAADVFPIQGNSLQCCIGVGSPLE